MGCPTFYIRTVTTRPNADRRICTNPQEASVSSEFSRRDFLRYSGATGAAAFIATTLSACSGGPASAGSVGAGSNKDLITAVIGYGNDQSWDPTQTASAFAMAGIQHLYEGLLD